MASLDAATKIPAAQIPTGIPQANIANLTAELASKADVRESNVGTVAGSGPIGVNVSVVIFKGTSPATGTLNTDTAVKKISIVNHGSANYTVQAGAGQSINGGSVVLAPGTPTAPSSVCLVRESNNSWWRI